MSGRAFSRYLTTYWARPDRSDLAEGQHSLTQRGDTAGDQPEVCGDVLADGMARLRDATIHAGRMMDRVVSGRSPHIVIFDELEVYGDVPFVSDAVGGVVFCHGAKLSGDASVRHSLRRRIWE